MTEECRIYPDAKQRDTYMCRQGQHIFLLSRVVQFTSTNLICYVPATFQGVFTMAHVFLACYFGCSLRAGVAVKVTRVMAVVQGVRLLRCLVSTLNSSIV